MTSKQIVSEIRSYFNNTSRTPEATLKGLQEIQDELDTDIESIKADLSAAGKDVE